MKDGIESLTINHLDGLTLTRARDLLGAVMIVGQEREATLLRALESLKAVDQVSLVDTAPGPCESRALIERLGGTGFRKGRFDWCDDFAAARNASIELATAEWLLWFDADDVLVEHYPGALKQWVPRIAHDAAGLLEVRMMRDGREVGSVAWQRRIFRKDSGAHFKGRIHEQLIGPQRAYQLTDVHIEHWGYAESDGRKAEKSARNRRLLAQALQDEPDNAFYRHQLGMQLLVDDEPAAALVELRRSLESVTPDAGFGALLYAHLVTAACQVGHWAAATEYVRQCPERWWSADLAYNAGVAWHNLGARDEARRWLRLAIRGRFGSLESDPANATWRPWLALAQMARFDAQVAIQRALETGANQQEVQDLAKELGL